MTDRCGMGENRHIDIIQVRMGTELQSRFSPWLRGGKTLLPGKSGKTSCRKWSLKQISTEGTRCRWACSEGISGNVDCKNKGSLPKRKECVQERNG